jgi:hypothetical protein
MTVTTKPDITLTIPISRSVYRRLMIEANMLNRPAGDVARDLIVTAFNTQDFAELYRPLMSAAADVEAELHRLAEVK